MYYILEFLKKLGPIRLLYLAIKGRSAKLAITTNKLADFQSDTTIYIK